VAPVGTRSRSTIRLDEAETLRAAIGAALRPREAEENPRK
jgi:hypothetical protein